MTPLEQLVAIETIKQPKARYFRFMDERDWQALGDTLAEDIDFEHPTVGRHHGRDQTVAALQVRLGRLSFTAHHGSMPEIRIDSADSASGIWSLHSCVISVAKPGQAPPVPFQGYGRYFDTYRKKGNVWRIATLRLVHLYKQS